MTMCVGHNLGMNQDSISTIFYVNALVVKQTYLRNVVSSNQIFQVANWRRQWVRVADNARLPAGPSEQTLILCILATTANLTM